MVVVPISVNGSKKSYIWDTVSVPLPGGWTRTSSKIDKNVVAQGYFHQDGNVLIDVFNQSRTDDILIAVGDESRLVPPGCAIGYSLRPPKGDNHVPNSSNDNYWKKLLDYVDNGYTLETGSGRNQFFCPQHLRAKEGMSPLAEAYFDKFTLFQLRRAYNLASDKFAMFPSLVGEAVWDPGWVHYDDVGLVTPMDTHHMENTLLWTIYLHTKNPRALDQIIRLMLWSLSTQDYYQLNASWPYGGIPRVPGWLNIALLRAAMGANLAGIASLEQKFLDTLMNHINLQASLAWTTENRSPFYSGPDGRHLPVPCNLPWQDALWGFSLWMAWKVKKIGKARDLATRINDYLEVDGWNHDSENPIFYDSIPHNKSDFQVPPRTVDTKSLGVWFAPSFVLDDRSFKSEDALIAYAKRTKTSPPPDYKSSLIYSKQNTQGLQFFLGEVF